MSAGAPPDQPTDATEPDGPGPDQSADGDESEWTLFALDMISVFGSVLLVAGLLFAISGVWPPLVAIESGSMEPHIQTNDLVFVMEADRFPGPGSHGDTGVVTAEAGDRTGYTRFQQPGDVIVFAPNGSDGRTPVIHRAMFWVEEGERWYDEADPEYVGGADSCAELANCPANESGFITKGDWNRQYDQVDGVSGPLSAPVRPEWIVGTAEARVPWLGNIRLRLGAVAGAGT